MLRSAGYNAQAWLNRSGARIDAVLALPGLLAVAVFVVFAAAEGGFQPTTWYPGGLFLVALAAVTLAARGDMLEASRPTLVAIVLFGGFVAWNFLSITWADATGVALEGANRSLLYFAAFTLFALWPWRPRSAAIVLGVFGIAIAVVGSVVLFKAAGAADPVGYFIKDRFSEPTGYPNGNAALFLGAVWPLVFLASRRETPWFFRGVALGGAGVLVELAILSQSRGSMLAGAITLALYVALVPGRSRSIIVLLPLAAVTALGLDSVLDVFTVSEARGDVSGALDRAADTITFTFAALLVIGAAIGLGDRYARISERVRRGGGIALGGAAGLAVVAGVVVLIAATGNPVTSVQDKWDEFKAGQPSQFDSNRFSTGLGSARYIYWRTAMDEFRDHPVAGIGSENFSIPYVLHRRAPADEPLFVHSFPVGVLSQTGLVGAALFAGFLLFSLIAFWRGRAGPEPLRHGLACTAVVAFAYWFFHATGDWLWELPAVAAPAVAWLGMAVGLGDGGLPPRLGAHPGRRIGWVVSATAVAVTVFALVAMVPPWLAARDFRDGTTGWQVDRHRAFEQLDRARDLNPLSEDADVATGSIASIVGDRARARLAFTRAVERNPKSWFAHQQLGIEDSLAGNRGQALAELEKARKLNPLEDTTRDLIRVVRLHERVSPAGVRQRLTARVCSRVPTVEGCR